MNKPGFLEGMLVALAATLGGGMLFSLGNSFLPGETITKIMIVILAFSYLLYLLARNRTTHGRLTALGLWLLCTALIWLLNPGFVLYAAAHAGVIWLIRSFLFHRNLYGLSMDLGLTSLSFLALLWALLHTGSLMLGIWCFFLLQGLFGAISGARDKSPDPAADAFSQAYRSAQAAVQQLTNSY